MIESLESLSLTGVDDPEVIMNFSGVAIVGSQLVIGADEGHSIYVFSESDDGYKWSTTIPLVSQGIIEIDIEAISHADGYLYVVGSHSKARKTLSKKKYTKNRERIALVKTESTRDHLCRLKLNSYGQVVPDAPIHVTSLRSVIADDAILSRFTSIPSKENGIDIEGIAASGDDWLYVGFRGPVLRGNWTPIVRTNFRDIGDYTLLFVNLRGLGIRDMERVEEGFLLLAGPVGDGPGEYEIFYWNGQDCIPGEGSPVGRCDSLGVLPLGAKQASNKAKAEGLSLLHESPTHFEVLIVFDSIRNGGATKYRVLKNP